MIYFIRFAIIFLEIFIIFFVLKILNKLKILHIYSEKTHGFLPFLIFLVVVSLTWKIPFERLFGIRFDSIDTSASYYLWGSGLKEKIKINDKNYVIIYRSGRNPVSFALFQQSQESWEPYNIGRSTLYEDLEIYYRKISKNDLLIFAYYISTDKKENSNYQIKDYLGNDLSVKFYEKIIPTAIQSENLICFYTTVKLNSDAYTITINNKKVNLK